MSDNLVLNVWLYALRDQANRMLYLHNLTESDVIPQAQGCESSNTNVIDLRDSERNS